MTRKRKKVQEDPPEGNFELLFLQLMMIMMAFFILLSSLSVVVDNKRLKAINSLTSAFSLLPAGANLSQGRGQSIPSREIGATNTATQRTAKELTDVAKLLGIGDATNILPLDKDTVLVRLPEHILFKSGQVELSQKILSFIDILADVLNQPEIQEITIEGHSDEVAPQSSRYASNWELSAARAMHVFHRLADRGIAKDRMIVAGMADTRPLPSIEANGNHAQNRRVDLRILFRPTTAKNVEILPQGRSQPVSAKSSKKGI